jgi:hypothetical protein
MWHVRKNVTKICITNDTEVTICGRWRKGGREGSGQELAMSIIWTYKETNRQKTRKLFICSYSVLLLSPPYSRALLGQSIGSSNSSCSFPSRSMKHAVTLPCPQQSTLEPPVYSLPTTAGYCQSTTDKRRQNPRKPILFR